MLSLKDQFNSDCLLDFYSVLDTYNDCSYVCGVFLYGVKLVAICVINQLAVYFALVWLLSIVQLDSIFGTAAHMRYTFISVTDRTIASVLLVLLTLLCPGQVRQGFSNVL